VDERDGRSAARLRSRLERGDGAGFPAALDQVPVPDRDAWVNLALALDAPPDDGPTLPRGCVPYLPCPVDALRWLLDASPLGPSDLFVDLGAGVGRAAVLVHLLAGVAAVGVEVQPALVSEARRLALRLKLERIAFVEGDAADLPGPARAGSVFFLYCPFGGERLVALLGRLEEVARGRPIRIFCVDLPLPPCPWLEAIAGPVVTPGGELAVYRSALSRRPDPPGPGAMAASGTACPPSAPAR
jgi:SAM-dependent methyltransferase